MENDGCIRQALALRISWLQGLYLLYQQDNCIWVVCLLVITIIPINQGGRGGLVCFPHCCLVLYNFSFCSLFYSSVNIATSNLWSFGRLEPIVLNYVWFGWLNPIISNRIYFDRTKFIFTWIDLFWHYLIWPFRFASFDLFKLDWIWFVLYFKIFWVKLDWPYQINPTMNGGGRSVLIWGQRCRILLGD